VAWTCVFHDIASVWGVDSLQAACLVAVRILQLID